MISGIILAALLALYPVHASAKTEKLEYAEVTKVIDGDTIQIEGGEKVRYIGIDTPELNIGKAGRNKKTECYAREALLKNHELVYEKTVGLERDQTDRDKYGRLLRYVYVGESRINDELVSGGYARAFIFPDDRKYATEIIAAEGAAKKRNVGMWAECGDREKEKAAESRWAKFTVKLRKMRNLFEEMINPKRMRCASGDC